MIRLESVYVDLDSRDLTVLQVGVVMESVITVTMVVCVMITLESVYVAWIHGPKLSYRYGSMPPLF